MWNAGLQSLAMVSLVLSCCSGVRSQTPQENKPLAVEDVLNTKKFAPLTPLALSPDGKKCAYTVQDNGRANSYAFGAYHRTGVPPWGIGADIWIQNIETGAPRNLTEGQGDSWLPSWSPDGHYLAFLSDRGPGGLARLWVWDVARDELRPASSASIRSNQIEWTPDSQRVLVTINPDGLSQKTGFPKVPTEPGEGGPSAAERSRPTVVLYRARAHSAEDETPSLADPWDLDESLHDLISVAIQGGQVKTLTDMHLSDCPE